MALSPSSPPAWAWIFGAGTFGLLAAQRLRRKYPEAQLLLIDARIDAQGPRSQSLAAAPSMVGGRPSEPDPGLSLSSLQRAPNVRLIQSEAGDFLAQHLTEEPLAHGVPLPQWIIPAVPVHLAWRWVLARLALSARDRKRDAESKSVPESNPATVQEIPVPQALEQQLLHPFRLPDGGLCASVTHTRCPDDCAEPTGLCPKTHQPPTMELDRLLAELEIPAFTGHLLRSEQLAPGVGGYQPQALQKVLAQIRARPGKHWLATSCRCHAIVGALCWTDPKI